MKVKKYASSILVLGLCFASSMNMSFANENKNIDSDDTKAIIEQQVSAFDELDKQIRENSSQIIHPDKSKSRSARSTVGNYPTRPGVFLVTRDGSLDKLLGHAGIVYNSATTVESFPNGGVGTYSNTWNTRYNTVYGATTLDITDEDDVNAANYAYEQKGKPYNWNFFNPDSDSSFYCSQLVYKAFKDTTGIDINKGGGIVFPIDLIESNKTHIVYSNGV